MLRIQPRRLVAVLPVLFLTAFTLAAQDQTIPLQNWAAPLYWQPPAAVKKPTGGKAVDVAGSFNM